MATTTQVTRTYLYRGVRIFTKKKGGWTYAYSVGGGLMAQSLKPFKTETAALNAAASSVDMNVKSKSKPKSRAKTKKKKSKRSTKRK